MSGSEPTRTETRDPIARRGRPKQIWGWLLLAGSPVGAVVFIALGALTINPCGAFGDGCDSHGESTSIGTAMFLMAFACLLGVVVGAALLIIGNVQNRSATRRSG